MSQSAEFTPGQLLVASTSKVMLWMWFDRLDQIGSIDRGDFLIIIDRVKYTNSNDTASISLNWRIKVLTRLGVGWVDNIHDVVWGYSVKPV